MAEGGKSGDGTVHLPDIGRLLVRPETKDLSPYVGDSYAEVHPDTAEQLQVCYRRYSIILICVGPLTVRVLHFRAPFSGCCPAHCRCLKMTLWSFTATEGALK